MTSHQRTAQIRTALPPSVILGHGEGGLSCIRVTGRGGEAEIYLQGAHLTSWQPAGQEPVIWTSRASAYAPKTPIRGGIPICFPWFGPNTADPTAPMHGLARLHDWELVEASEVDDNVVLSFQLDDSGDTRSSWPFHFTATYRVIVGTTLQLSLEITNLGTRVVPSRRRCTPTSPSATCVRSRSAA